MKEYLFLSLVGQDRIGLVDRISQVIAEALGNIEESRMATLGSEFAMLLLVGLESGQKGKLQAALEAAARELDMALTVKPTTARQARPDAMPVEVRVTGMDHEGIVHEVVHYFAGHGSSVETLDSDISHGAFSATPLFSMRMRVVMPASSSLATIRKDLDRLGDRLNVTIEVDATAPALA